MPGSRELYEERAREIRNSEGWHYADELSYSGAALARAADHLADRIGDDRSAHTGRIQAALARSAPGQHGASAASPPASATPDPLPCAARAEASSTNLRRGQTVRSPDPRRTPPPSQSPPGCRFPPPSTAGDGFYHGEAHMRPDQTLVTLQREGTHITARTSEPFIQEATAGTSEHDPRTAT